MNFKTTDIPTEKWKILLNQQSKKIHELMCIMCIIIFPIFAFFDIYTIPASEYWLLTTVRLSISFIILVWLIIQKKYHTPQIFLALFAFCALSWFCAWACMLGQEKYLYQHNIAYCTVFLAASLFLLWHWWYSVIIVASSIGIYLGFVMYYQYFTINVALLEGGSVLLTLMILHPVIVYFRYQSYKREYILQINIEDSNEKLKETILKAEQWNVELLIAREELHDTNEELKTTNQNLENIVKARTHNLETTNNKLQKALAEIDGFLYSSYHDIKGPIARLRGLTLLLGKPTTVIENNVLEKYFVKTVDEMETLILKLDKVNKINQHVPSPKPIHVGMLFEDIIKLNILNSFTDIETTIHAPQNLYLHSDLSILNLILECLIDNSLKYRAPDRKCIIKLTANSTIFGVQFAIEDNGDGILPTVIDKIFKMFYRGHIKSSGHGLGLYLVKKALEKLDGNIEVESIENGNTKFKFFVPNAKYA